MTGRLLLAWAAASVLLSAAAVPAEAKLFKGRTSQRGAITFHTDDADYVTVLRISWRGGCGVNGEWKAVTEFRPFDFSRGPGHVRVRKVRYYVRDGNRTYAVRAWIRGRRTSRRKWRGTFGGSAMAWQNGRFMARCASGPVRWTATARRAPRAS